MKLFLGTLMLIAFAFTVGNSSTEAARRYYYYAPYPSYYYEPYYGYYGPYYGGPHVITGLAHGIIDLI